MYGFCVGERVVEEELRGDDVYIVRSEETLVVKGLEIRAKTIKKIVIRNINKQTPPSLSLSKKNFLGQ